jgi:hypothetical protein
MADTHEISYIGGELDLFALAKHWKAITRYHYTSGVGSGCGHQRRTVVLHDGTARRWAVGRNA